MLSFLAASVDALEQRLREPAGGTGAAAELAALIAGGGGTPDDAQLDVVADLLAELGRPVDGVDHSSAAGEWFREDVIGGPVADRFGAELAEHLLSRPLAGLVWEGYPSLGWVRNGELPDDAGTRLPDADPATDPILRRVAGALARVRESGPDLVTYYS